MTTHHSRQRISIGRGRRDRQGNMLVLMATVLVAIVAVAGLTINIAQMEVARTELRMATDASAKAATVVLGQTQSTSEARKHARQMAARYTVSGQPFAIRNGDIQFGNAVRNGNGSYDFVHNGKPLNSVRVTAAVGEGRAAGPITYFMRRIGGPDKFSLNQEAIATRVDHDICLVIDRSGSMAWDLSNDEWSYPGDEDGSILQNYFLPPHPTASRWAAVRRAADVFIDELEKLPVDTQLGLVSFSSNFVFGVYESEASTIECDLALSYDAIADALEVISEEPIIGNTNIASGIQTGVEVLTAGDSRITAKATMVVLTDGVWTQGTDPVVVAAATAKANITIHTITFSDQADQTLMARVAQAGGGNHYHAPTEAALKDVFRQIAETLPAVLVH